MAKGKRGSDPGQAGRGVGDEQLQARFEEQLVAFERIRGFIERCHALGDQFSPAVVKKVVADYESQSLEVVGAIMMLQPDLEAALNALQAQRAAVVGGVESSKLALEELELRLAIGQIEDDDFEAEASRYRGDVEAADEQLLLVDHGIEVFEGLLLRWAEAGQAAGVLKAA